MTTVSMDNETPKEIDFEIIDSRTFSESDYTTTFLIDGIMTEGQPQLYGGPSKSMKTSVLVDHSPMYMGVSAVRHSFVATKDEML